MKEQTKIDLFNYYCGYWIVQLGLDKNYKFEIKKDNRLNCPAMVRHLDANKYEIRFNTKDLSTRWRIISYALHELGHVLYDFRTGNSTDHEYQAELFALKIMKESYPLEYAKAIESNKKILKQRKLEIEYRDGWGKAMKEMGEI